MKRKTLSLAFVATSLLSVTIAFPSPQEEVFPGYSWESVGDGVYVHRRVDPFAGPVDGNSVVIVNANDVFVVDTHIDPAAARAVIGKIRQITSAPVTHVINTHWHDDHTNGNHAYRQAFPDARILSHTKTLERLRQEWPAMEEQRRAAYESVRGRDILAAAAAMEAEDPQRAIEFRLFAGYRDALEPELPTLELIYPDVVFEDRMAFERADREIIVQWMGRGNTDGDLVVWLPSDGVLITGDIVVSPVPYAFDSPMVEWVETLGRLAELGAELIIPGHGEPLRDDRYLRQLTELLAATLEETRQARAAGVAYEDLDSAVDLEARERAFTQGDPIRVHAWRSYFLTPGLRSAWASLGYPVP